MLLLHKNDCHGVSTERAGKAMERTNEIEADTKCILSKIIKQLVVVDVTPFIEESKFFFYGTLYYRMGGGLNQTKQVLMTHHCLESNKNKAH